MTGASVDIGAAEKRIRLGELLCEAAELEHSLLCQYLFAAFSFKRSDAEDRALTGMQLESMRRWHGSLLLVARQEMEHLGIVGNLLTVIGEAPYLERPNFPVSGRRYKMKVKGELQRFGLEALKRFVMFEIPTDPSELTPEQVELLHRIDPSFDHGDYVTLGELYGEIKQLFGELDGPGLFIGPPSAELLDYGAIRGVGVPGAGSYGVELSPVTDLASATAVIDQIITEGEGGPQSPAGSHFSRFCTMFEELEQAHTADPGFDPARPVVANAQKARFKGPAKDLVELFDLAYETTMVMLFRIFASTDGTPDDMAALQMAVFFPMMTTVLRPLGEIITRHPADPKRPQLGTAGPRFWFDRGVALLPYRVAAFALIRSRLELLAAKGLACRALLTDPGDMARLELTSENLLRMAANFGDATGVSS